MTLRVVGAGLGRTGTTSLKVALEQLLGGPCYHMMEVFPREDHVARWQAAGRGQAVDWDALFEGFLATTDWPGCSFWQEILERNPDALVLLSTRSSPDVWWKSARDTIFFGLTDVPPPTDPDEVSFEAMWDAITRSRFTAEWREEGPAKEAYLRHNEEVRRRTPAGQLLEWQPGDGWAPICEALGLPVPDAPFPHANTTEEFRARFTGTDE